MAMQKMLTKKERFFNNINLTSDDEVYVGIDVHKVKCHVAIWLNEAIALTFVTPRRVPKALSYSIIRTCLMSF
jgi:hypothetical protein